MVKIVCSYKNIKYIKYLYNSFVFLCIFFVMYMFFEDLYMYIELFLCVFVKLSNWIINVF